MTPRAIFVSYSQPDREAATAVVSYLETRGLDCWVAPRDVAPGTDWAEEIVDAIAAARVMVLVFSSSANSSPQVRREVERAVHRRVAVLPFRIEHVLPSRSLEYFLSSQHWLDAFPPPMEPHHARLYSYLRSVLPAEALPATAPVGSLGATPVAAGAPAPAAAATHPSAGDAAVGAATLQRLESELARYIGPVARLLVSRAARRSSGIDALIVDLGAEIESESDRRKFIQASRQSLRGGS